MLISVLTIMPDLFGDFLNGPVISRAVRNGVLEVEIIDIRDYAPGSFRHIDDSPFGGGAGMVMRCQPVLDALRSCKKRASRASRAFRASDGLSTEQSEKRTESSCASAEREAVDMPGSWSFRSSDGLSTEQSEKRTESSCASAEREAADMPGKSFEEADRREDCTVIMSPAGTPYTQKKAHYFAGLNHLILICGHYEGMDARIFPHADEQLSIGDYVLTGGELAAQVVIDSIARLLPGSLREMSTQEESFENGLLEYPQYTQPAVFEGEEVPAVLRSGNHERIRRWRLQQSLLLTRKMRPDLFGAHVLNEEEKELLAEADREEIQR